MSQPKTHRLMIELPSGCTRFIREVFRSDGGELIDASHSIYPPTSPPTTTLAELSEAFPDCNFHVSDRR